MLLVDAGLDVGYLALGPALVRPRRWRGDGLAVLVQSAFLLVLDSAAAHRLIRPLRLALSGAEC